MSDHDQLPGIRLIVADAIADGLITSVTTDEFRVQCAILKEGPLEDYIQTLFDEL